MKKFFYRKLTFYTNSMMTEKIMSYVYLKKFKNDMSQNGQINWNSFYEDLYKSANADFNRYHNPGKVLFPIAVERITFFQLIKSFFDKKCKRIFPSI